MDEQRLYALDLAIQRHPEAPVNYLLRGEFWMEAGKTDLAEQDLMTARALALEALEDADWGYIYQSYIDRAETLLQRLNKT